jgi:putative membrane protein
VIEMTMWWHAGWHGAWFLVFPLFWLAVAVVLAIVFRRRWSRGPSRAAEDALGERYARGEITEQEYRERMGVLRDASR